jgi:hypothetical protein
MFNQFAFTILERLCGQKLPVLLHEISGTSDRTWRNRFKHGWNPTDEERKHLQDRATTELTKKMVSVGEWSADEARKILAERPSAKIGIPLPTADLVYQFSPRHGEYCGEAVALAIHFDRDCESLAEAVRSGDVDKAREVLVAMLNWLRTFCPEDSEDADARTLQSELEASSDIETLLLAAKPLVEALLFHVLSCWDLEFCAGYFDSTMQAYPLFQLVMPRFAPDIEIEPETGRLLRDGRQPRKRIFETATSRLFDFLSVLVAWRRYRRLPESLPRVKDFAAWSSQDESRLVSWRDETTKFTARQLEQLWTSALTPDSEGIYPAVPSPMFVCAHLWSPLLGREDGRATQLIDCTANYRLWWERNRDRLVAKGLQFGKQAWPDYLTAVRSDNGSLASAFSAQSAGRSAQPRDCQ